MSCNLPSVPEKLVQNGVQMKTQRERDKGNRENEERHQPVCLPVCSSVLLSVYFLAVMTSPYDQSPQKKATHLPLTLSFSLCLPLLSHSLFRLSLCNHSITLSLSVSIIFCPVLHWAPCPLYYSVGYIASEYPCNFHPSQPVSLILAHISASNL